MKRILSIIMMCCVVLSISAQKEMQQLADSIVKYQMKSGGWPKNQDWLKGVDPKEAKAWQKTGVGSTIDNGATTSEMQSLAKAVDQIVVMLAENSVWLDKEMLKERRKNYTESFKRGVEYLLKMQYPSGGFPQFYPLKGADEYSAQITFNDQAMVNALKVLRDVGGDSLRFRNMDVDKGLKKKCKAAYEQGIRCVLLCQIRVDESGRVLDFDTPSWKGGTPTVWCQQHDRVTFMPAKARVYELPSYSGCGETCAILDLLMDEPLPSAEVKAAVKAGVAWLEAHAMKDVAVEHFTNENGQADIRLVEKKGAPLLWARFYDLDKGEPFFCDRDGVPQKHLSDIGYERRNGYSWVGNDPKCVIERCKKLEY
ncbi:MAG: pectate lyase [Bacteroidaceae bacterium]|nr:pectate lyase [Bacteroidaceae bacterium]